MLLHPFNFLRSNKSLKQAKKILYLYSAHSSKFSLTITLSLALAWCNQCRFGQCSFFKSKNVSILNFRPLIGGIKIKTNLYSVILEERKKTNSFNPLTTNDELSLHENLTFLWYLGASRPMLLMLCNTLSSNKMSKNSEKG